MFKTPTSYGNLLTGGTPTQSSVYDHFIPQRAVDFNLGWTAITLNTDTSPFGWWNYEMGGKHSVNSIFLVQSNTKSHNLNVGISSSPSQNPVCAFVDHLSGWY